ncbi:solute carrier family 25 member 45 [Myxocyprinus asiaticus]|uniref:solute carrier family 25 member 45 n=1 Tax=Myxocyprinus asiaticus TaxID=70543 RepID=UPI002223E8BE|nr:solute carrier family 25 member 45 [Myxocyprinus asiaticus]
MPFEEFIAGWISGAVGLVFGHPLDTVKVRLQTQSVYSGILDCVVKTYTHEGFHGFFKGMAFPVLTIALSNSVAFGSYSNALNYLTQSHRSNSDQTNRSPLPAVFMAGCFSGLSQVFVTAPIDLVKVRLQSQTRGRSGGNKYRGPRHCVAVILREDGVKGLFRGMWALALRDVPCYGLYFLPYELICRMLTETGKQTGPFAVLMAGGVAGVVTWACATPMDVIKARLQMSGAGGRLYNGVLHCITVSVREEGMRVFFKGLLLNSVRAFPVNAVTFLCFEMIMRAMTDYSQD